MELYAKQNTQGAMIASVDRDSLKINLYNFGNVNLIFFTEETLELMIQNKKTEISQSFKSKKKLEKGLENYKFTGYTRIFW